MRSEDLPHGTEIRNGIAYLLDGRVLNFINGEWNPIEVGDNHDAEKADAGILSCESKYLDKSLAQAVREFVDQTKGTFSANQIDNELGLIGKDKKTRRVILHRLVEDGLLERIKPGQYRVLEKALPDMSWREADTSAALDLKLPFGIHNLVEIYPKNILVIAGASNAGKTAYLLSFIRGNMHKWDIHYFTCELSEQELKKRIERFGDDITSWTFHAHERNGNFDSVLYPEAVNIIDYLEPPSGEYYAVADQISAIHSKLTTGIAFIAIQKKKGTELGRGAEFSEERARLYLSMDSGKLKIVKAKNWKTETNPNGITYTYKLIDGCKFIDIQQGRGN